jgi:hypothetical protein
MLKRTLLLIIFGVFIFLAVGCTFLTDWLYPPAPNRPKMSLSIDPKPSYIGEEFEVSVSTKPSGTLSFIKVVLVDEINNQEIEMQMEDTNRASFSFTVPSSSFKIYAESPFQKIEKENAVWLPSKSSSYYIQDYSPPNVIVNAQRVSFSSNEYDLILNVQERESNVRSVYYEINGQRQYLQAKKGEITTRVTLPIGNHMIKGYASNDSNLTGSSSRFNLNVTPPRVDSKPTITLETVSPVEAFDGEMIYLTAQIEDPKSYLDNVELISNKGWSRRFNFDPLQENYYLNYLIKVEEDQVIKIKAINGNKISESKEVEIIKKDHKVPDVQLTVTPSGDLFEMGTKMELEFTSTANDGETLTNIFVLVNGSTYQSFMANNSETYSGRVTYNLMKGENIFTVIAQDSQDARGSSDPIMVEGEKIDREPPLIQMLLPSIAYTGVDVELPFTVEDYDSGIEGNPIIKNENEVLNAYTFDDYYYIAEWTPQATGNYMFTVEAKDTEGNEASAKKTVRVKDPTGIVWPTIGELAVTPDPITLGASANVSISVIPPAYDLTINPIVQLYVSTPGGNQSGLTNVQKNGNIYHASYSPETKGTHIAQAIVQWDEYQYTKSYAFEVLSPDPTLTFTVEPSQTYIGDEVIIKLQTDTSNPYASVTVIEMSVDDDPLIWQTTVNNDQKLYTTQKSTINLGAGQHVVKVRIRDSFGNESLKTKLFNLIEPTLEIESINLKPVEGQKIMVYGETYFEVYIKRAIPETINIDGTLSVTGFGDETAFNLERTSDAYIYRTEENWTPTKEGTFIASANMIATIGTEIHTDAASKIVTVGQPALNMESFTTIPDKTIFTLGEEFDCRLILSNLEDYSLSVQFYLVDPVTEQMIPNVQPIMGVSTDQKEFITEKPFKLNKEIPFKLAAEVTIIDIDNYQLTYYSTPALEMVNPGVTISLMEPSKIYYKSSNNDYENLFKFRVYVSAPNMQIKSPVVELVDETKGSIEPYSSTPSDENNISYYAYKFKPAVLEDIDVSIKIYETKDDTLENVVEEATYTLDVEEFIPRILVESDPDGEFVGGKVPKITVSLLNEPELYSGDYEFKAKLSTDEAISNAQNQGLFPNSTTELIFESGPLYDQLGEDKAEVSVELIARGNMDFSTQTTRDFDVSTPTVRIKNLLLDTPYIVYRESDITLELINISKVTEYIDVDLYIDGVKTNCDKLFDLDPTTEVGFVHLSGIVFNENKKYDIRTDLVYNNVATPKVLDTATSEATPLPINDLKPEIKYPGNTVYYQELLNPIVNTRNIPGVPEEEGGVKFTVQNGVNEEEISAIPIGNDDWSWPEGEEMLMEHLGESTLVIQVFSEIEGISTTATKNFTVEIGDITDINFGRGENAGGDLVYPDEYVDFVCDFIYENPYNVPSWTPSIIPEGTNTAIVISNSTFDEQTISGQKKKYTVRFSVGNKDGVTNPVSLQTGENQVNFKIVPGASDTAISKTTSLRVVPSLPSNLQMVLTVDGQNVTPGTNFEAYVQFIGVNKEFVEEYATPVFDYLQPNFNIPNCVPVGEPDYVRTFSATSSNYYLKVSQEFTPLANPDADGPVVINANITVSRDPAGEIGGEPWSEKDFQFTINY